MDMGYWAMDANAPKNVIAKQAGATDLSPPINSIIAWEFDPTPYSAPEGFAFRWYDGYIDARFDRKSWQLMKESDEYNHPSDTVLEGTNFSKYGSAVIGESGKLFFHRGKNRWVIASGRLRLSRARTDVTAGSGTESVPRVARRIEGKIDQAGSNFGVAGPMTETILLGVLAQRTPDQTLEWDATSLKVKGRPDLDPHIRRQYREGWKSPV